MTANSEYDRALKSNLHSLRRNFPERERLRELVTREVEQLGMTCEEFFQPYTFGNVLQSKQSPLLEAIALVVEDRAAHKDFQATTSVVRPSG